MGRVQEDFGKQELEEYQLRRSAPALSSQELSRLHIAAVIFGAAAADEVPASGGPPWQLGGSAEASGPLPPTLAAAAAAAYSEEAARMQLALRQDDAHVRTVHTARDCLRRVAGAAVSQAPPASGHLEGVHVRRFSPVSCVLPVYLPMSVIEKETAHRTVAWACPKDKGQGCL